MNCDELENRIRSFPKKYLENFDYVWNWKVSIEEAGNSIFDDKHFSEAFWRLSKILPK